MTVSFAAAWAKNQLRSWGARFSRWRVKSVVARAKRAPSFSKEAESGNGVIRRISNKAMEEPSTVYAHPDITNVVEIVNNKLYLATLRSGRKEARSTADIRFFTVDGELVYDNFYNDFGPLNIACLYKYCRKVNKKLKNPANKHRKIVHYTSRCEQGRANAAYLIASYAVLYLNKSAKEAYKPFLAGNESPLKPFRDASMGPPIYNIYLIDCLNAISKAASFGFFNFDDFDLAEYETYEQMRNGDLNWTVPRKFLAFVGPSTEPGTVYHPPECYIDYFTRSGIVAVVRLSRKTYDAARFASAGIEHYDMFMPDGSVPPRRILNQFLNLAENTSGPIAVHCKAGLGRTGSLVAAYLVKHYRMSAREAIAWIRICRPGSVIGHQQTWLENMENNLLNAGQQFRSKYHGDSDMILHHRRGIYSIADKLERKARSEERCDRSNDGKRRESKACNVPSVDKIGKTRLARILEKFRNAGATDALLENRTYDLRPYKKDASVCRAKGSDARRPTQGDRLNEIKMNRDALNANRSAPEQNGAVRAREVLPKSPKRK